MSSRDGSTSHVGSLLDDSSAVVVRPIPMTPAKKLLFVGGMLLAAGLMLLPDDRLSSAVNAAIAGMGLLFMGFLVVSTVRWRRRANFRLSRGQLSYTGTGAAEVVSEPGRAGRVVRVVVEEGRASTSRQLWVAADGSCKAFLHEGRGWDFAALHELRLQAGLQVESVPTPMTLDEVRVAYPGSVSVLLAQPDRLRVVGVAAFIAIMVIVAIVDWVAG